MGAKSSKPTSKKSGKEDLNMDFDKPTIYSVNEKDVCIEDFDLLNVIGKGSFGKVMQVKKKDTGKVYAMKVLKKEQLIARNQVQHTKAERCILQAIKHPFIVGLEYAFQTGDKLYMVMDYINGGELFFHLKKEGRFSEERVRFYVAEITLALGHLHKNGIIYRDLKPENILLDNNGHVVLTDFGLSKDLQSMDGNTHTFCGTPEYLAPEVLKATGHGKAVDWWSLGTLMYEMLVGLPPFYSQNVQTMYRKILHDPLSFPPHVSPLAQSLLKGLLARDPYKRTGGGEGDAMELIHHPFFRGIDWDRLERRQILAPFIPDVKDVSDLSQFDTCFTQEKAIDSVVESHLPAQDANQFEGFTYVPDSELGGH
eukprot:GCRY01001814.1.p1 GENE.GCRY01001814.1~~GCRY01001814.1.p1  ORF type:complete len:368 (-),score=36.94 GCRY01001814.1:608-1711(-)